MNELEQIIAGLPHPEPGKGLDERIDFLLAPKTLPPPKPRRKLPFVWPALAACCGLLGFYLGRGSAERPRVIVPAVVEKDDWGTSQDLAKVDPRVVSVPLTEREFSHLFVRSKGGASAFGPGPLTIKTSTTP